MGLEAVKEEVLDNARQQSNAIIADARNESNRIAREAEKNIEEIKQHSEEETRKMLDTIKKQELASADLENKKMLLEAKKQVIDNVFAESKKRLESMEDKKREALIKKVLDKTKGDIEITYVYCNKKDLRFLKGFAIQPADIIGGLIAENKDKTIRVDYSFDTLLQIIKENELQNINKILFT